MIFDEIDKVVNKFYKETEHLSRERHMPKLKTFNSEINLKFTDNSLVSHSKKEYIEDLKELFLNDYGIFLKDDQISNIQITREEEV